MAESMNKPAGGLFYGWIIVLAGFMLTASYGVFYTLTVFFSAIQAEFHWSSTLISSIHSLHLLTFMPVGILVSYLIEHYEPRRIFGICAVIVGTGICLLSQVHTITQFYLFYILATLGTGGMWAPAIAITQRWFVEKRGLALGIVSSGIGAGALVHAPLANYLIASFGWRQSYLIEGGITFLFLAVGAVLMVSDPEKKGLKPLGAGSTNKSTGELLDESEAWSLAEAAKTSALWAISLSYLFTVLPIHLIAVHFVPFATGAGINKAAASAAWGLLNGASIVGRIWMGSAAHKFGWKKALILCCLGCAVTTGWLITIRVAWLLYLFALIYGFFYGGKVPQLLGLLGQCFGTKSLAQVTAFAHSVSLIGAVTGPVLGGFIFDQTGSYFAAFIISASSWFLAAVLAAFVTKPVHLPQRTQKAQST